MTSGWRQPSGAIFIQSRRNLIRSISVRYGSVIFGWSLRIIWFHIHQPGLLFISFSNKFHSSWTDTKLMFKQRSLDRFILKRSIYRLGFILIMEWDAQYFNIYYGTRIFTKNQSNLSFSRINSFLIFQFSVRIFTLWCDLPLDHTIFWKAIVVDWCLYLLFIFSDYSIISFKWYSVIRGHMVLSTKIL